LCGIREGKNSGIAAVFSLSPSQTTVIAGLTRNPLKKQADSSLRLALVMPLGLPRMTGILNYTPSFNSDGVQYR